ncbi:MAG TPA: ABC transporter substrate-binding protein [Bacillota bacterium]|nr:ABC transporter substrate-binding protein [Bacillota bacterium]
MKKFSFVLVLLSSIVLTAVAFAGAAGTFKIGLSAPITGNFAEYGENFKYSVLMAADKINASGGIKGRKLIVEVQDSKGDPKEAALIAQKFVQDQEIVATIGEFSSTSSLAAAPIYERNGLVQLSPTASHPDFAKSGEYMFGIIGTQDAEGPFNARYIAKKYLKLKSVAAIYVNNDWGVVTKDRFVAAAKKEGLKIISQQPFFETEKDFNAVLTKARAGNPDGIFIAAMYNEAALISRQIKKLGWKVKLMAPSSVFSEKMLEIGGDAVEGLATNTFFALNDPDPKVQTYITEFKKRAGRNPNLHAASAYDSTLILADAIKKAGFDRKAIRNQLAKTKNFPGITGKVTFTPVGDVVRKYKVMVIENGQWVVKKDYTK